MHSGVFTISLDFELYWGVRDHRSIKEYRKNLEGAREVIPEMLKLFEEYKVHATWATVGFLFAESKKQIFQLTDIGENPTYSKATLSPYSYIDQIGEKESEDPMHYAASLIRLIAETPYQEVASHTFSHYYCLETGQTIHQFKDDLKRFQEIAEDYFLPIHSIVFPRNQFGKEHLDALKEFGIEAYRGNPESYIYRPRKREEENLFIRMIRLLDTYINLTGSHAARIKQDDTLINVPASSFFRPYNATLRLIEPLKLRRIKESMIVAAKHHKVYHLWWHPHNFGINKKENLSQLKSILEHYKYLKMKYSMVSYNMGEIAAMNQIHG